MAITDKYPIDFEQVTKGQNFTLEELQHILGKKPENESAFRFAVMGFALMIRDHTGFTCKITEDGLRVLPDNEASEHNWKEFKRCKRGLVTRYTLSQNVDTTNLNGEERSRHEARLISQSRTVQAILREKKSVPVAPAQIEENKS